MTRDRRDPDPHEERDYLLGETRIENLRKLPDEETLLGTVDLFGLRCHATFIRVEGGDGDDQRPVSDPYDRWQALCEADPEGAFQTVEIPGFDGEYAFFVSPFLR